MKINTIMFSTETISIKSCPHNSEWIKAVFPNHYQKMMENPIICSGPIMGSAEVIIKTLELLFSIPEWNSFWISPPDQAFINYIVYTGLLDKHNIKYDIVPNNGFMTTVGYCDRKADLLYDNSGNIGCNHSKIAPSLIHQYIRQRKMRDHVKKVCNDSGIMWSFKENPYSKSQF